MAAAESILKSGEVSAMLKQGFIFPTATSLRHSPIPSPPSSSPSPPLGGAANHPSPPPPSFLSPKPFVAPTLFEMISREDPRQPPPGSSPGRRGRLHEMVSAAVARWGPGDVDLSVSSGDGFRVSVTAHRRVLEARSRFFAEKLGRWSGDGAMGSKKVAVEICDCDDVEVYVEVVAMMYWEDLNKRLAGEEVPKVLALLQVSAAIMFDAGVASCLKFLEAVPWSEDDEEKVVSVLSQLRLQDLATGVLQRVSVEPSTSTKAGTVLSGVLTGILQAKDEKARREMKAMIAKLVGGSDDGNALGVSKETLYHLCYKCLSSLRMCLFEAASMGESQRDRGDLMSDVAHEADNLQWLVEILISKRMGEEFVNLWADQTELASLHLKFPCMYRFEISKITAQLCVALGRGQLLVSKNTRYSLLQTWLDALYEDFSWMRRSWRNLDKKMIEDGLCHLILTLPMSQQQTILLRWFDHFLNKGDDCPNIQRAFEVWWRRAFVKQYINNPNHSQLQIAVCDYPR